MADMAPFPQLHASAVAIDGRGILLLGDSGAGKSDLALRLMDRTARLIADDRVDLVRDGDRVLMSAPQRLAGLIEVRGLGIFRVDNLDQAPLALAVRLVPRETMERLPEPAHDTFLGIAVPLVQLDPFEVSAPIKVEWALRRMPVNVVTAL
jgi:HPr kinase/phosphorylase